MGGGVFGDEILRDEILGMTSEVTSEVAFGETACVPGGMLSFDFTLDSRCGAWMGPFGEVGRRGFSTVLASG